MSLKKKLDQLDKLVASGKIMEAFEEFFAENVITHSDAGDKSEGKTQKREFLTGFFNNIAETEDIKLHGSVIDGNESYSKFTFKFKNHQGEHLKWHEIIKRTWENELVIDEYYFQQSFQELKDEIKKKQAKAKKIAKKSEVENKSLPKSNETTTKSDNLKLVEGIGPKIEQLLHADGIKSFKDLAKAKQKQLEKILTNAGPRFSMHSPSTWPQQADLLVKGKKEELKILQDELKGGKVVV